MFMQTGLASTVTISSDNASYFCAALTKEFLQRVGVSPRFSTPYHPNACGIVERAIGSVKNIINKVAYSHPKEWYEYLPYVMWALREVPNESTGVPPYLLVHGKLARGPLAILKETWVGARDYPLSLGKTASEFLQELKEKFEIAQIYADAHTKIAQKKYVDHYNLRSRDKHFEVGEECLILMPDDTTSKVFARWKGPAKIVDVPSKYSYLVEFNGARYHLHANKLRKFQVRVDEVTCNAMSLTVCDNMAGCNCAMIYETDSDFGSVCVVDPPVDRELEAESLPSRRIDPAALAHLTERQRSELLEVLDRHAKCFADTPGLCELVQHEIPITADFRPKRLRAYRVPENLKHEVNKQISELLRLGFIVPSSSPMASPIVCVLKAGGGVRIAINYQYVNRYTIPDVTPLEDVQEIIQKVGNAKYISLYDAKSGYWQCKVRSQDQWLTAFVCDSGLYEWTRCPFGLRSSGCTFLKNLRQILEPVRAFVASYVDDTAVYSNDWESHIAHTDRYLSTIEASGMTLNLNKAIFAKSEIKFVGHIIGSGKRRIDPARAASIQQLKTPETKKQVRQIMGLFSHFREYIPNFAQHAQVLTDLTSKKSPERVPWGNKEQQAFDKLKELLCKATMQPLNVIDSSRPFCVSVDASEGAVGGMLTQPMPDGTEQPVAFVSCKLNATQRNWSTIEKEAYAAIWCLQKFRHWIFGTPITLYSDHNPLTFLTDSAPKSSKLMRWALALQEFNIQFVYRAGKCNKAADCLSRMVS